MRAVAGSPASLAEELAGTHNVLLLAPPLGDEDGDACRSLLWGPPATDLNVLSVTFNQSPDARIERWRAADELTHSANLGFVVVGDGVRSTAAAQAPLEGPDTDDLGPTITSVSSPADLTGIGIEIGHFFEEWGGDGRELRLCFHTLTTFLQYADLRTVYQFLHVLTGRVRTNGGLAHYHLDPTAHDQRTVNSLLGLVDAVVERGANGDWEVRRRR